MSALLQKVIVLGGRAGSDKMREWARHELNGYDEGIVLPKYRRLHVPLYAMLTNPFGYNGREQRIPPSALPDAIAEMVPVEQLNLGAGVGELEAMVAAGDQSNEPHHLSPDWSDLLGSWLQEHNVEQSTTRVSALYYKVPNASIKGVLVHIRTALAELVADLVSMTPDGEEVPDQANADRAVMYIFNGGRPTVNHTTQHHQRPNVSVPDAHSAVLATDHSTAIGSQAASGKNSSVVGTQSADGEDATLAGHDNTTPAPTEEPAGFWARLRKRGLFVALFTVIAGAIAVFTWIGWTSW
ncbi:AbiTii domain-containing protein [Kribbella sp. NPDC002412]